MKYLFMTSALAASVALATASPVHAETGYGTRQVKADHRPRSFTAHIWYPANDGGTKLRLGAGAFFRGIDVSLAAPPKPGAYPVVLLSHGSG